MIAKARKTATRRAVRRKRRGKKVSVNETRIVTAAAKRKKKPASRKVAAKKNAAKKARRTSSALPRAAHTITGRDSAEDARVARHKARREYWSRFAVEHRTELDELIAALLAFFQRAFKADFEIRSRHHLVYVFELTAPRWSLFAPAINQLPLIQAKGFTLTPRQMERLNTVQDLAMQLLAGPGRTPMPSPILKGGRPPESPPKPSDKSADLPRAGGDNDKPAVQPNERPSFFFELEGDGTNGDEVLFGREFWILFDYGVLKRRGLAVVKGKELDRLVRPDTRATLGIDIVPIGLTLLEGGAGQVMRFENGAKVGVPGFRLRAPEKQDAEPAPRGVSVIFTVDGAMIYNFFLEIRLVDELDETRSVMPTIDLDLPAIVAVKVEQPRVARIYLKTKGDVWQVYGMTNDTPGFAPTDTTLVSRAALESAYRGTTLGEYIAIANNAIWRNIDINLDGDADDSDKALASMKATAAAGWKLYEFLSADPAFQQALELIESLPDGSRITIYSDGTAFPWELLYPLQYVDGYPEENYRPDRFWGRRFIIESLLVDSGTEKPPASRRQPAPLRVGMGYNSGIDAESPWNLPGRKLLPVQVQLDYFKDTLKGRGSYFNAYDKLFDTLRTAYPASLLYYFCHGSANQLKFDEVRSTFTPTHIMGAPYPGWPVVFLNACDAADISPLSFFSFRSKFRAKKAAGLIAPSFPVPTLFAAVFARAFLEAYSRYQPVGDILFRLRRELLAKNNPLGLWYSLQCPLDLKAPEG